MTARMRESRLCYGTTREIEPRTTHDRCVRADAGRGLLGTE
ncbi:hypothetical protein C7S16_1741 [Burkholderia thailandensis]|uniref:Uncharacterized protein n=1 Tax=Burkholderia thailandensis TaxID=57975 RepID=A0AAW9CY25_BURTH|nr:hypothetical protein [Burkholderia thailandensis]MDW9255509.1 hypothetical protein [Burkholderia thailandensis]